MRAVMDWLLNSSIERHDFIASVLDRWMDSDKSFRLMLGAGIVSTALTLSAWYFLFLGLLWYSHMRAIRFNEATVAIWEANVWFSVLFVALSIVSLASQTEDVAHVLRSGGRLLTWVIIMYLTVELVVPPRKRKEREEKVARQKVVWLGEMTQVLRWT